ncbi:MAG: hypothetical protein JWP91_1946 [Fibrobacteres bacterium]|nr:hypothetical protein [Fibrobacterota bacterium]
MRPGSMLFCFAANALSLALPSVRAVPLEVDFTVTDKLGKPVSGARICLQEDDTQCTQTNGDGRSSFSAAVGNRSVTPSPAGISVSLRNGRLSIASPSSQAARIARFDSRGRSMGPVLEMDLRPGANGLDLPGRREGLFFFQVTVPGHSFSGKALSLAGSSASGAGAGGAGTDATPRVAALGKVATANLHALILSKNGYRSILYRPKTDRDTGVVVRMAATSDTGVQYAGIIRAKVVSIDSANHALNYAYTETRCSGSSQVSLEQNASLPFWIKDGKWYFPAGNCQGVVLGKTGTGIYGAWKTLGVEGYPPGLFPIGCDPIKDSVITGVLNLFFLSQSGGWDIDLRQDSMTIAIHRELCPGNQAIYDIAYYDGLEGRPLLVKNTCREVEFRNAADEPGIYSFANGADSLGGKFTYKDKTCPMPGIPTSVETTAPKTCPETQSAPLAADTTFQRCVRNTGFIPSTP